jgi:hypothetical protein
MSILSEPAIAHLGEADRVHDIAMAIPAVAEVPCSRRMPADHGPLAWSTCCLGALQYSTVFAELNLMIKLVRENTNCSFPRPTAPLSDATSCDSNNLAASSWLSRMAISV